jgi:hypothetical protein
MKKLLAGVASVALVTTSLSAQLVEAPTQVNGVPVTTEALVEAPAAQADLVAPPLPPKPAVLMLDKGAPITLAVAEEVNSSTHKAGDKFQLTVLNDVRVGDAIVIPRGTPATAEITWRTGKGAFGKSGKLEFALVSIDHKDGRIPVTGTFRQEGEGNTVATGVGILAVGIFAGFITGKRARLPVGRELLSQVAQPVEFTSDGHIAGSFDSVTALAAAEAGTDLGKCKAEANALDKPKKREKAVEKCYDQKRME